MGNEGIRLGEDEYREYWERHVESGTSLGSMRNLVQWKLPEVYEYEID